MNKETIQHIERELAKSHQKKLNRRVSRMSKISNMVKYKIQLTSSKYHLH